MDQVTENENDAYETETNIQTKPNKIMYGTSQATLTMYTPGDKE
jgi:hypothetical protein